MTGNYSYWILVVGISILPFTSLSQDQGSKDVEKMSLSSERDICRLKLDSARTVFDSDPGYALSLVEDGLLIAIKQNFQDLEGEAYQLLGDFNYSLGQNELSLKNYEKAIQILSERVEPKRSKKASSRKIESESSAYAERAPAPYEIYKLAGKAAEYSGHLDRSLEYYSWFLSLANQQNQTEDILFAKVAIADVYSRLGRFAEAEVLYNEVLAVEQSRDNKKGIVAVNNKLGMLYQQKDEEDIALSFFSQSRDIAIEIEDDEAVNQAFDNMTEVLDKQEDVPQQLEVSQQAMQYNEARGNVRELARNTIEIGNLYIETDSSEKAIEHLQRGVELSDEAGDIETKSKAVKALSEAYEKEGSESVALEKYKEYVILEDSLNRFYKDQIEATSMKGRLLENTQNKLLMLEKDKELDEKTIELLRREKRLKEEELRRQKLISWFLVSGLLLLLIASVFVYRSNRERRRANRLLMLKSLRSQMNPHFIFNALNSVNSYISSSDERAANKYLSDFSRLMRDVLENSAHDFIPLSKEIEILDLYLKLEHSRFKEKFDYMFEVDESIDREAYRIPPMLIQPYIENAVWHGLRYKKDKGYLHVFFKDKKEAVEIRIIDDGIGRKKSQELKTENQKIFKSTGLKNINHRLNIIREVYRVELDVEVRDLNPDAGTGTSVRILLSKNSFAHA